MNFHNIRSLFDLYRIYTELFHVLTDGMTTVTRNTGYYHSIIIVPFNLRGRDQRALRSFGISSMLRYGVGRIDSGTYY